MSSCILTGSVQTTPQVSSGDSEAKPLIFTFVPTVRRLPTHSQLADTSKFLVKIPEEPSDKNPETVNRSNFSEYLTLKAGSQQQRDGGALTYPSAVIGKISQVREFKVNKPQGMQQSGLFKAEYAFIVDSEGEDEATSRKVEQSPPGGMGTTATRPTSLAISSSLVSDVVRPKTRAANLQAPSHPEMPHGMASQQKHGQSTSSSTTSEQLACKPPAFSFVSPTNQKAPPDPTKLSGASALEEFHTRRLDARGALVEETATYFQTSAHSSPFFASKGTSSTFQFPHSTQLSGSNLSSPSEADQKPGRTSEVLRKTASASHVLRPGESPRPSSPLLSSSASLKSNSASYIPVRFVMHSLSPSPKPFPSSLHGSSSTICSPVSSSGNLSRSGVKSLVPSRLSLLTAILKSNPSHQRPLSPASCPTFSLNSLASSTLTLDQKAKHTPSSPKKSLSSCSLSARSPGQREHQDSEFSQPSFHLPFFTQSAPPPQAHPLSPTKHESSSLASLNVEKTPSPTSLKSNPIPSLLQTKTSSSVGLPPASQRFYPFSWKSKRDAALRGPEKPRNIYTYPSASDSSMSPSAFPTNQRATLSSPEKSFHPSPVLSDLLHRSQRASAQLSGQGQNPSAPTSPPVSSASSACLPKLGSSPSPHANLPTQALQLSPSALHPNCGSGTLPSRFGKSESSISDHRSSVSTPSPSTSLTRTKELISPCAFSMPTDPENKKPKQYKTSSSYKAFAAIPTNTLLLEQKALDEPAKTENVSKDNTLDPPLEFCFPAQLRQQTEELCATIDKVLQDSLSMHSSGSPSSSLQKLLGSDTTKTPTTLQRSAGRETKYANLSPPSSTVSESQLTKPGVIRPVPVKSKILLKKEEETYEPNPFSKYLEDNSDLFSEQDVTVPHKPVSLHPLYQTRLYPPAKSLLHPQTLSHADCLTPGPFSHLSSSLTDEQENSHTLFSHNAYNKLSHPMVAIPEHETLDSKEINTSLETHISFCKSLLPRATGWMEVKTEIWMEKQYISQRQVDLGADFTRNHTVLEGTRFKRAIFKGQYCRSFGCCEDRDDDCVTQFYEANALCYCDKFCERDTSDCCPDYKSFCHEEKEWPPHTKPWYPEGCLRDGLHYEEGSVIKENCNSCTCSGQQWKCSQQVCLIEPELIEHVNNGNYGWTAQNYSQFWGMTLEEGFKYRLGTLPPSPKLLSMNEMTAPLPAITDLPEFFVASYKWPGWTHGPLDQKNCAASWAFSTASVAADRIAIQSKGRYTANLSPQNLISCCPKNRHGCNSGSIDRAWWYLRKRGLVSHACYPLFKDQNATNNACAMASRSDGRGKRHATKPCPNNIEKSNRIYQCSPPYRVSSNETEIMKEIIHNGPVQAIMQVHEDFFHYKSGIYRHVTSTNEESEKYRKLRTHAIKLTGWGTLRGAQGQKEKFWIAANSWGKSWGENGYFRILRGVNESDIEKLIIAAWGQLTSSDEP